MNQNCRITNIILTAEIELLFYTNHVFINRSSSLTKLDKFRKCILTPRGFVSFVACIMWSSFLDRIICFGAAGYEHWAMSFEESGIVYGTWNSFDAHGQW